jgi:hypothetical protein
MWYCGGGSRLTHIGANANEVGMSVNFNHTIVYARDSRASATFLAEILGLAAPRRWGPFQVVATDNGANIDFMDADGEITPQHYAFLVSESEFDGIFCRLISCNPLVSAALGPRGEFNRTAPKASSG